VTLFVGAFLQSKLSRCVYESNRQFCQYMFFHYNRLWILLNSSSLFLLCLRHVFFLPAAHFSLFSSLLFFLFKSASRDHEKFAKLTRLRRSLEVEDVWTRQSGEERTTSQKFCRVGKTGDSKSYTKPEEPLF